MVEIWHEWPTNFSNGTESVNGVADFFIGYPTHVTSFFGIGILIVIWLGAFTLSMMSGLRKALAVSSFVSAILGIYLWRAGAIGIEPIFVLVILIIVGLIGGKEENSL